MKSLHTPGPWVWTDGENPIDIATYKAPGYYNNPVLKGSDGGLVVGCDEYDIIGPFKGGPAYIANASLIAAAPETLGALRITTRVLEEILPTLTDESDCEVVASAIREGRAAIAKAEGKS